MPRIFRIIAGILLIGAFASCSTYYQVYEVDSPDIILYENDYFVDTSTSLHVIYDFWSEGGIPIIELANAYPDTILVDFRKSNFVISADTFSFAPKDRPDSVRNYDNDFGYNVLFDAMPGSVYIPPDSSFIFEGILWTFDWSGDVSRKKPSERYIYSSSPQKMDHLFVYSYADPSGTQSPSIRTDTIYHRFYLSSVTQVENATFQKRIQSELLSNKFYVRPESGWPEETRFDIANTLLSLFLGE